MTTVCVLDVMSRPGLQVICPGLLGDSSKADTTQILCLISGILIEQVCLSVNFKIPNM